MGYYTCYKRIQSIHINDNIDETLQRFVCAHELYSFYCIKVKMHLLKKNTFFTTNKNEVEANTFAVELLIPDKCIYEFKDTSVTINEVAQTYGVPEEMCNLKKLII